MAPVLVDGALVRDLERVADACRLATLRRVAERPGDPLGVTFLEAGAVTAVAAERRPTDATHNRVLGLDPAEVGRVREVVSWYRRRSIWPWFEVAPGEAAPVLLDALAAEGAWPVGFTAVLVGSMGEVARPVVPHVTVEEVHARPAPSPFAPPADATTPGIPLAQDGGDGLHGGGAPADDQADAPWITPDDDPAPVVVGGPGSQSGDTAVLGATPGPGTAAGVYDTHDTAASAHGQAGSYGDPAPTTAPAPPPPDDVEIWATTMATGMGVDPIALAEPVAELMLWAGIEGLSLQLAHLDGEPVGASALWLDPPHALLAVSAVRLEHHGRGVHHALMAHRLEQATAAGCTLVSAQCAFGSTAHRNLQGIGLRNAYSKVLLHLGG